MQQKRRRSRKGLIFAVLFGLLIGAGAWLMTADIPVQQKAVEKPLDAKTFLEPKQS